jgi:hypothetical protein
MLHHSAAHIVVPVAPDQAVQLLQHLLVLLLCQQRRGLHLGLRPSFLLLARAAAAAAERVRSQMATRGTCRRGSRRAIGKLTQGKLPTQRYHQTDMQLLACQTQILTLRIDG